nr:transposase [Streptomyces sp. NRRL S-813]
MSDAEWAVVRPLLPVPAWMEGRGGRPEAYCHRQLIDAVRYLTWEGVRWASLPRDFPKWRAVYRFFRRWRDNDLIRELYARLRRRLRELAGKKSEPSAAIIDSQSVKGDATVPARSRGYDAGKKTSDAENTSSGKGQVRFPWGREGHGLCPMSHACCARSATWLSDSVYASASGHASPRSRRRPAAGRRSCVRSWVRETDLAERTACVSVQREERDPQRFWIAACDALRATGAGAGLVRPLTEAPDLDGWTPHRSRRTRRTRHPRPAPLRPVYVPGCRPLPAAQP